MPGRDAKRRKQLFSLYASNLSLYFPDETDRFLCPVCRIAFARDALSSDPPKVALAHIVPQSFGGHLSTLACRKCDNEIGSAYDSHVKREKDLRDWQQGEQPLFGRLRYQGTDVGVATSLKDDGRRWEFTFIEGQSHPASIKQFFDTAEASWDGFGFSLTLRAYTPNRRNRSLLYSAFLMTFYEFGYEYVLSPNADRVRAAIKAGDARRHLCGAIVAVPHGSIAVPRLPSAGVLVEPTEFRCFVVALPSPCQDQVARWVLLPGFGHEGMKAYDRLLDRAGRLQNLRGKFRSDDPAPRLGDPNCKWFGHWAWRNLT